MDEDLHDPVGRKRRGGLHQRVQSQKGESLAGEVSFGGQPPLLADWLKEQWAWGQLSPQAVEHIASLAKKGYACFRSNRNPKLFAQAFNAALKGHLPTIATEICGI
jgi:hypothetical protein